MTGEALRSQGVALAGVAALLRGGVSADVAFAAGAARVPALGQAADRLAAGLTPAAALAEALPAFAPHLTTGDATLPDRLDRLSEACVRRYGLARRLRAVSAYPLVMALGLLVIGVGVFLGDVWGREALFSELGAPIRAPLGPALLGGIAVIVFLLGLLGRITRTPPIWLRLLPGQRVYGLSAAADLLAQYALHRDPALGDRGPEGAAQALALPSAEAGLGARGAAFVVPMLRLAEAAPRPAEALRDAVERLDLAADRAARHLAASTATVLLLAIALGVLALGFSSIFRPLFEMAG